MRPTLGEAHIYGGLLLAAAGLGWALGWGWGLLLFGFGLLPIGVVLAATEQDEEPPEEQPGEFAGLSTASAVTPVQIPQPDEEVA